eukprot:3163978-Prymnesium_polylepis.1
MVSLSWPWDGRLTPRGREGGGPRSGVGRAAVAALHQSTPLPWPLDWMTSGARYSGVPHSVHVLSSTTWWGETG